LKIVYFIVGLCLTLTALPLYAESKPSSASARMIAPAPCKLEEKNKTIQLSAPILKGLSVEQALQHRRSERRYGSEELSMEQLSQLLWAAQGITRPESGQRTAPSSGRSYPIDLYISLQRVSGLRCGLYRYQPVTHSLTLVHEADYAAALTIAAEGQSWVRNAAVVILHVATPARAAVKYGKKTALPSSLIEAGHISQNIYLQATSLGLAVLGMNGFNQSQLDSLIGLQSGQMTLFMNLVGVRPGS